MLLFFTGLSASAAILTVTIESRTSASVSCQPASEMPEQVQSQYSNTGSKGQITQGDLAVLTLSGLPKGVVQSITLYMHSNAKSGAATVTVTLAGQTWQVASGPFMDWPGQTAYSAIDQPLTCLPTPATIAANASLQVTIEGTYNSVYLQQMVVEYTPSPPEPHTLTLHWFQSDETWHTRQLTETSVASGVQLPDLTSTQRSFQYDGETWNWLGWCEQPVETASSEPVHWEAGDWYYPDESSHLYALFSNASPNAIQQDTSYMSGEYAMVTLVNTEPYAMCGSWQDEKIELSPVSLSEHSDAYYWALSSLAAAYRYQLTFEADSVTVQNVANKAWIGHSAKASNHSKTKWAWRRAGKGSVYIYATWRYVELSETESYYDGLCLSQRYDLETGPYVGYKTDMYVPEYIYWLLYPTADIPERLHTIFTTFSNLSPIPEIIQNMPSAVKILRPDGNIYILRDNQQFNILGNRL